MRSREIQFDRTHKMKLGLSERKTKAPREEVSLNNESKDLIGLNDLRQAGGRRRTRLQNPLQEGGLVNSWSTSRQGQFIQIQCLEFSPNLADSLPDIPLAATLNPEMALSVSPQITNAADINNPESQILVKIYLYNLRKNRQAGFRRVADLLAQDEECYIIVCGGDGTVMWVISQLKKHGIDSWTTPIGIIPLGTGNDFSRNLGWGGQAFQLVENEFAGLKKLIALWNRAEVQFFDIWDIYAEVRSRPQHPSTQPPITLSGKFQKVERAEDTIIPGLALRRSFANYFSIGIDGKIGYSFDKRRTNSRLGNLCMYGCLGGLKSLEKTKSIPELIESMSLLSETEAKKIILRLKLMSQGSVQGPKSHKSAQIHLFPDSSTEEKAEISNIIFAGAFGLIGNDSGFQKKILKTNLGNLLALNINSFMGGTQGIWQHAKVQFEQQLKNQQSAPVPIEAPLPPKQEKPTLDSTLPQSSSDGLLQFVGFSSALEMALEKIKKGHATRLAQSNGPFLIRFKEFTDPQMRTYLQIDGQFIRMSHPNIILIIKSEDSREGKIRVLRNRYPQAIY